MPLLTSAESVPYPYDDKLFISSGKRSDFGLATRFGTVLLYPNLL
jgi:hypothetical protein